MPVNNNTTAQSTAQAGTPAADQQKMDDAAKLQEDAQAFQLFMAKLKADESKHKAVMSWMNALSDNMKSATR